MGHTSGQADVVGTDNETYSIDLAMYMVGKIYFPYVEKASRSQADGGKRLARKFARDLVFLACRVTCCRLTFGFLFLTTRNDFKKMSIPANNEAPPPVFDRKANSKFTYRDLHLLSQYSTITPLRVISLVDYDAFYASCETVRLGLPHSQPLAVQQWHHIIALNYAGRGFGFKRGATAVEVKRLCPHIVLQHVATWREGESSWAYREDAAEPSNMKKDKAALDPYRIQSRKSLEVIKAALPPAPLQKIEKASVDEVFLDLSAQVHSTLLSRYPELLPSVRMPGDHLPLPPPNLSFDPESHLIETDESDIEEGLDWDVVALQIGSEIISNLRKVIRERMGYTCSAGIAHNKALAKLAAGYKKPNQQTVVRAQAVSKFLSSQKMTSIRGLAGKLGAHALEAFESNEIPKLLEIPIERLKAELGSESGTWLFDMLRGKENSEVTPRTDLQSMLSQKTFAPPLKDAEQAANWIRIFAADLVGRISDLEVETGNQRRPTVVSFHHHIKGRFGPTRSKQTTVPKGSAFTEELLYTTSRQLLEQISHEGPTWPCQAIGVSVHKFEAHITRNERITSFFVKGTLPQQKRKREEPSAEEVPAFRIYSNDKLSVVKQRERFFTPRASNSRTPADQPLHKPLQSGERDPVAGYTCPKCSKAIDDSLILEHLDFHFALELDEIHR